MMKHENWIKPCIFEEFHMASVAHNAVDRVMNRFDAIIRIVGITTRVPSFITHIVVIVVARKEVIDAIS